MLNSDVLTNILNVRINQIITPSKIPLISKRIKNLKAVSLLFNGLVSNILIGKLKIIKKEYDVRLTETKLVIIKTGESLNIENKDNVYE